MTHRWIIAAALAAYGIAPMAQTVYESKDGGGPMFSDRPFAGAVALSLDRPNVVSTPATTPKVAPASSTAVTLPYRRFVINRPAEQNTVHTRTGEFGISASVSPPLRSSDRIRVLLDGKLLPSLHRGTNLRISESDWQSAAIGNQGEHQIQLAVVDADGKPWIETAPLSFFVQRAAVPRPSDVSKAD
jgi:hypothetical protein